MRKYALAAAVFGAPLLLTLAFIGCGPPEDKGPSETTTDAGGSKGPATTTSAAMKPLEGKAGATLRGRVVLKGKEPDIAALTQQLQTIMKGKPDQMTACFDMAPEAEKSEQVWKIGKDNGVGNVVVWIQPPEGSYFKSDPAKPTWPLKVELTQPHCAFIPHVNWALPTVLTDNPKKPVPSGQKFFVSNTAAVSHNTKWSGGANEGELPPLAPNSPPREVNLAGTSVNQRVQVVHFQCNIHPWMDAWVLVFNHPYVAVTDADGNYKIENVPAGSKVHITAWHEKGLYENYLTKSKIKGDEIESEGRRQRTQLRLRVQRAVTGAPVSRDAQRSAQEKSSAARRG